MLRQLSFHGMLTDMCHFSDCVSCRLFTVALSGCKLSISILLGAAVRTALAAFQMIPEWSTCCIEDALAAGQQAVHRAGQQHLLQGLEPHRCHEGQLGLHA